MKTKILVTACLVTSGLVPALGNNFFELARQGFQNGGRSGLRSDSVYQFNGSTFVFEEPDYLGAKSGLADDNPEGPAVWVRFLGGYDSNAIGFKDGDGLWFVGAQLGASETWDNGATKFFLGGRLKVLQYEDDVFRRGRKGSSDSTIYDLDLRAGTQRAFSPSVVLTAFHHLNLGGIKEFGEPYILPGISRQDQLLYRASSQLVYRFDRSPVGDPGLQFTTGLRSMLSAGLDNDERDVRRLEVRQNVDYLVRPDLSVGVEGRVGFNTWEEWDDLDSTSYHLLATAGGRSANGIHYHAAAGWEWRTYDEDDFVDDRDNLYVELKISGEVTDAFYVAAGLTYGIETVRPGRKIGSADPMALKAAVTGVLDHGPYAIAGLATYSRYEADLFSGANSEWDRWSLGVSVDRELGNNSKVGLSVEYAQIDTSRDNFDDLEALIRWWRGF